jgi:putative oxidoreductase
MGKRGVSSRAVKLSNQLKKYWLHPYLGLALRLYIGAIFIYASMYKINYAGEFAETIASYQLAPYWAVNLLALTMPWLELICGLLLVVGFRSKSAAVIIAALLVLFSGAIGISLIRDLPIGCGCFSALEEQLNWNTLVRDLVWLAMVVQVYFSDSALQLEKRFAWKVSEI